ncbi:MAG: hypothetical protein WCI05_19425 [Myxococcales bacterium]
MIPRASAVSRAVVQCNGGVDLRSEAITSRLRVASELRDLRSALALAREPDGPLP